jgi:hypothetical protein
MTTKKKKTMPVSPGRPAGSKNASTLLREAVEGKSTDIILKHFPKIVEKACQLAEDGDTKAMKLLMDRIIPVRKAADRGTGEGHKGVTILIQGLETKQTETIDAEVVDVPEEEAPQGGIS